jgi:ABC-type branched-subunit amino acid transport system substrate-binding protein
MPVWPCAPPPSTIVASSWGVRARAFAAVAGVVVLTGGGCPRGSGALDVETLPALTTEDPRAEAELRAAREAADGGRWAEAASRYRQFLERFPTDPLVPVAELGLGRALLGPGDCDGEGDDGRDIAGALEWLERAERAADAPTAERARFYAGVALHCGRRPAEALARLRPLVGRVVDPVEKALLLRTVAAASERLGERVEALAMLDALTRAGMPDDERRRAQERIDPIVASLGADDLARAERTLPRDGPAWAAVKLRSLREAVAAGDRVRARAAAESLRAAGVELEGELATLAARAIAEPSADPRVVGAVLPLSGRGREVGRSALRGLMTAAGIPSDGPQPPGAPRLVFRDSAGEPERAAAAVEELVRRHRAIAIIGPLGAEETAAAAARAQQLGVPLLALSSAPAVPAAGDRVFRFFPTLSGEVRALVAAARGRRGARRFALLAPQGPYGDGVRTALADALADDAGGFLAAEARYPPGSSSFGPQVQTVAAAAPDAVLIADDPRTVASVAPALAAAGVVPALADASLQRGARAVALLLPSTAFDPALLRSSARHLQGAVVALAFHAPTAHGAARAFVEAHERQMGEAPDVIAAVAYDAFRLVRAAVDRGAATREELARALPGLALDSACALGGLGGTREPLRSTRVYEVRDALLIPLPDAL